MIRIKLTRSYIGVPEKHRKILRALGLKKIGCSIQHNDTKAIQGMVHKVSHLVSVEHVD